MRRTLFSAMLSLAAVAGCHDHSENVAPACTNPDLVSLPNCSASGATDLFSDEACTALDDTVARATPSADRAAALTEPPDNATLSAATAPTFVWEAPVARRLDLGPGPRYATRPLSPRDELGRYTRLINPAEAHCAPFTGRAYELRLSVGATVVFRRQQSTTRYTLNAAEWARVRAAAGASAVTVTLYTATLNQNLISTGSGPFVAPARRFTVGG